MVIPMEGTHLLFLDFDVENTYLVIHDNCYRDFYRKGASSVKTITLFEKAKDGDFVYDRDTASFIANDETIAELKDRQRYTASTVQTPFQNISESFLAYVETDDIVFADLAVTDRPIDVYINATVSVAGLKLTWSSATNVVFNGASSRIKLGNTDLTGSFENDVVRFTGKRFIKSVKLSPQSRASEAVRYKIYADFVNNGYDDIEIHDINLLTEMLYAEVTGDTDA